MKIGHNGLQSSQVVHASPADHLTKNRQQLTLGRRFIHGEAPAPKTMNQLEPALAGRFKVISVIGTVGMLGVAAFFNRQNFSLYSDRNKGNPPPFYPC
jgi:hypothetical protein